MPATPSGRTAAATRAYATRHAADLGPDAFRPLGRTGWSVSALGFGSYRIEEAHSGHREALTRALARGINLVDTSSNYTDGGSESMIGSVLNPGGAHLPGREAVILVTKAGYIQGQNLRMAKAAAAEGRPFPEIVEYHPQCWHCIHPLFLADQLHRSLERLRTDAVHVYLLHNPEYFFSDWVRRNPGGDATTVRPEFYRRCRAAFEWMEQQAAAGRIGGYGVSSNTFGYPEHHPEFVRLQELIDIAAAAATAVHGRARESHFTVVQCPVNLLESGPALERNQPDGSTFLGLARKAGLAVLVNRPLNALNGGKITRLAAFPDPRPEWSGELEQALGRLEASEHRFADRFRREIAHQLPSDAHPLDPFHWSGAFRKLPPGLREQEAWIEVLHATVYPQIEGNARAVAANLPEPARRQEFAEWFQEYARAVEGAAELLGEGLGRFRAGESRELQARLAPLLPPALRDKPLSQLALRVVLSVPGVTCVLNGMRSIAYVDDSLGALALHPLDAEQALEILRRMGDGV
jgi:hypothetical protein